MDQHIGMNFILKCFFRSDLNFSKFTDAGNTTLCRALSGDDWIKTAIGTVIDTEYQYIAQKYPTQPPTP